MNLANNLTILRILLVPAFIISLTYYSPEQSYFLSIGIAVFILACFTDALDGYVARRFNQKSTLGSYIDPIADKLLLISGFLCLSYMTHLPAETRIPAWVTIPVISRDVIIIIGSVMVFVITGGFKAQPLPISKLTTVLQMTALFFSLSRAPRLVQQSFFILTLVFTVISGVQYVKIGSRLLSAANNGTGSAANGRRPALKR